ncbi:histidine phosphatase family protein [Paraburkholderia caballeronis]|uniref:histidine phosphatase family protein n=1 Tax=Paraburkholderia caballeronis TaxID=416943 RepID=UPI0010653910|nr:histidine phosphatase family protein [Paraburkholderia caballeronis]TDV03524.1 putative phosphoglycerate mutase [Paraburkholderia caballeronis]TDV08415.1 putative phosphoglycerate mutase [Paraburkholderia caballeronis]TDV19772.1 putative phosphoglycerate mutase [Paraburkholderia caballeronis]
MSAASAAEVTIPREIWLIRHGETEWSRSGQHTGRTDVPLTERGRAQALALAPVLAAQHFDAVLSSPLTRALDTCRLAGLGDAAEPEPALLEWDYGQYEGLTTPQIRAQQPGWTVWSAPVPQGESLEQVQARAQSLVGRLLAMPGRVALFSHAHFLRALAGCWIGDAAALGAHFYLDTASISILGFDREHRAIRQWNRVPESCQQI